jgi:predicted lipoprotein with Yx(FWY)xxD motif
MLQPSSHARVRLALRAAGLSVALLAGVAAAVIVGTAAASSFTLRVTKNVHVTNTPTKAFRAVAVDKHEAVAVGPSGFPVYTFQGEFVRGAMRHLICQKTSSAATNCWAFWPPVSPSSATNLTKQSGIKGKLATFRNHGTLQLTLNGQPLYYFAPDIQSGNKHMATGDELKTFGSIWHVVVAHVSGGSGQNTTTTTTTTTTTPSYGTSTNPYGTPTSVSYPTTTPGY